MDRLVTWKELRQYIPYTRQHFERLGRAGKAPVRRKFRNRAVWVWSEVQEWLKQFQPVPQPDSSA